MAYVREDIRNIWEKSDENSEQQYEENPFEDRKRFPFFVGEFFLQEKADGAGNGKKNEIPKGSEEGEHR